MLQLMNHGRDLDRLLNENPNDYYKLVDREGPRVHKTLAAKLHFDLLKLEKFKTSFKPVVVWRETLWEESILLLQRFLIRKHQGDDSHLSKLARAISLTGQAYHEGLLWRPSIPLRVAHSAAKENLDAMFRMHLKGVGLSDEEIDMRFAMTEFEEELDAAHADDGIIAAANKALSELDPNQDD
ncbi:MAG TPA: hypothetical protein VJ123_03965 [Anaerolineales bacterium]|nr:hypothetical protein [Anaerolineales bacterium]